MLGFTFNTSHGADYQRDCVNVSFVPVWDTWSNLPAYLPLPTQPGNDFNHKSYIYIWIVYVCVHVYVWVYTYTYIDIHMYIYIYIFIHIYVYMYIYIYVYIYMHIGIICVYICPYHFHICFFVCIPLRAIIHTSYLLLPRMWIRLSAVLNRTWDVQSRETSTKMEIDYP